MLRPGDTLRLNTNATYPPTVFPATLQGFNSALGNSSEIVLRTPEQVLLFNK